MLSLIVPTLCSFFRREVHRLPETYTWPIAKELTEFAEAGQRGYQPTITFKESLRNKWFQANEERRLELAKVIMKWGVIRGNNEETLQRYVGEIAIPNPSTPLHGIASYSKIFAIVKPEQYAIYDARVAACLNAIQINSGMRKGVAFNYVPGRNNIVGNTENKSGFTQDARFSVKTLVGSGWIPIKRNQTYTKYLETLSLCLDKLQTETPRIENIPPYSLATLEMALFARAVDECQRAMANGT